MRTAYNGFFKDVGHPTPATVRNACVSLNRRSIEALLSPLLLVAGLAMHIMRSIEIHENKW